MKNIKITITFLLLLTLTSSIKSQSKYTLIVKDINNTPIEYYLTTSDGETYYSNFGTIYFDSQDFDRIAGKTLLLKFKDDYAYKAYYPDLYFSNGDNKNDKHIDSDKIILKNIFTLNNRLVTLYFRTHSNDLDSK